MGAPSNTDRKAWEDFEDEFPTTLGNPPEADREPVGGPVVVGTMPEELASAARQRSAKARKAKAED